MHSYYPRAKRLNFGAVVLPGIFVMTAAASGNAAEEAATGVRSSSTVEEVVVSGLRIERLQDTPMAVSRVSAADLVDSGFKEPKDLQFLSPSIQVSLQGANAIYIRGSGTNSQNGGSEQSVGMVIDGVLQGFVDDIGGDLSDLDHVEVYRGPQGTQFAKNASAGVVSILTRKPQLGAYSLDANLSYGEHHDTSNSLTANLPIGNTMAARLTAGYQSRDGVFLNPTRNEMQGGREQKSFRGRFLWQPSDATTALVTADYRDTFERPNFPQAWGRCGPAGPTTPYVNSFGTNNVPPCNGALLVGVVPSPTNTMPVDEADAWRTTRTGGVSLQIDHNFGDYKFTSISAWRTMDRHFYSPVGSGTITLSSFDNVYTGDQYSQEFRITSPDDQKLTYVGGVFLYQRKTINDILRNGKYFGEAYYKYPDTPYGEDVLISNEGGLTRTWNDNKSYAAFVDGAWHLTDKFQLNGGFRATRDDVSGKVNTILVPGVYPFNVGGAIKPNTSMEVQNTGYTYRFGPQYFFTPDIQAFATFAHGYKGPIVDNVVSVATEILPEEVDMFEVGLKSTLLNGRLNLNLSAYHQEYDNYQVVVLNVDVVPSTSQLGNAKGLRSQGVELETTFAPDDHWLLGAAVALNDAEYTDFITACWDSREPIKQATSGKNGCYVRPGTSGPSANAAGTPLVNASKWTYRLNLGYTTTFLGGYEFDADAIYQHRSSWQSQPMDPNVTNPGYGVLTLNAGVTTPSGRFRVGVFARNALDEYFLAGTQPFFGGWSHVLNPEAMRTVGVTVSAKL